MTLQNRLIVHTRIFIDMIRMHLEEDNEQQRLYIYL